jgi:hypothetical protein
MNGTALTRLWIATGSTPVRTSRQWLDRDLFHAEY